VGGGDIGLARALNEGLLQGPRLFYGGRILSQTGGHADIRSADRIDPSVCACSHAPPRSLFASVVDGVDAVRAATRDEFRKGAHHIKIMASGGVTSPTDPLDASQFSDAEITACVDEATRLGKYVAAHCHPDAAIRRCVALGVRSIEHATLITSETAQMVAQAGAITVPTMSVIFAFKGEGERLDLPAASREKLETVSLRALESLDIMRQAKVKMGFGTDLPGTHLEHYGTEFTLRAKVLAPSDILISATGTNAALLGHSSTLGVIAPNAVADILVVKGNPIDDIGLLAGDGTALRVIMKGGEFYKRSL
jgi:imidazolonepropionase-like amidohydrolase